MVALGTRDPVAVTRLLTGDKQLVSVNSLGRGTATRRPAYLSQRRRGSPIVKRGLYKRDQRNDAWDSHAQITWRMKSPFD